MTQQYKPSYFLAGKIDYGYDDQERIPIIDLSLDKIHEIDDLYGYYVDTVGYNNLSGYEKARMFSAWTKTRKGEDLPHMPYVCALSDYENLKKPLTTTIIHDTYTITGPGIILDGAGCWSHGGYFEDGQESYDYKIVSKRNREMIMNADVFSLKINVNVDCMQSIVEAGIAWDQGKAIVIFFEEPEEGDDEAFIKTETDFNKHIKKYKEYFHKRKDFHFLIHHSIDSLEQNENRDIIIKCHPSLEMNTFEEYKKYLQDITENEVEIETFSEFKIRQVAKYLGLPIRFARRFREDAIDDDFNKCRNHRTATDIAMLFKDYQLRN